MDGFVDYEGRLKKLWQSILDRLENHEARVRAPLTNFGQ